MDEKEEIVSKECLKCRKVQSLENFYRHPKSLGKRKSQCITCAKQYKDFASQRMAEYRKKRKPISQEYFREYYLKHREKIKERAKSHYDIKKDDPDFKRKRAESKRDWVRRNPHKITEQNHRRAASKLGLLKDWTSDDMIKTLEYFDYKCALSGEDGNLHFDHVIPLSSGHAGTVPWNMLPLRSDLNESKSTHHILEWFDANRQRFNLSEERLEFALRYLADTAGLNYEEYLEYLDWCHKNKNLEE